MPRYFLKVRLKATMFDSIDVKKICPGPQMNLMPGARLIFLNSGMLNAHARP
jgi:hypothetical protein